jgi:O-antigen/teichoic acid export membrane protein
MEKRIFLKNGVALVFVQIANYLAPFMVLPYLTRVLGVEGFGLISLSLSMILIGNIILDFGFTLSGPYFVSKNRNESVVISEYLTTSIIIKVLLYFFVVTGLLLYFEYVDVGYNTSSYLLSLVCLNIFFVGFLPTWFFQGIERMISVTIYVVAAKVVYVGLVFLFVKNKEDADIVLLLLLLSNFVATFSAYLLIYKVGYRLGRSSLLLVKSNIKGNINFFFSRLAVSSYTSASVLLVGSVLGVQAAAIYSCAEKLYMAAQNLTAPVSQVLFPHLSRTKDARYLFRSVSVLIFPMIICCVFVSINASFVIELIFGVDFVSAADILIVFLICLPVTFVSMNFGYPAFSIIERLDIVNRTVYAGCFLHVLNMLVLLWLDIFSGYNVAMSILLVEFVIMSCRLALFFHLFDKLKFLGKIR